MSNALLSVMGLYIAEPSLFDDFHLPDQVQRSALIDLLVSDLAELNVIYSDPDILKFLIGTWSGTRVDIWTHLYDTTQYEYNPIWNKDGSYKEIETRDLAGTLDGTSKTDQTRKEDRSAYDSSSYQPVSRDTTNADNTISNNSTDKGTVIRERTEKGNIGVTTTQQMIQEERNIADFDIYRIIIDEFKHRFCVMVY